MGLGGGGGWGAVGTLMHTAKPERANLGVVIILHNHFTDPNHCPKQTKQSVLERCRRGGGNRAPSSVAAD